MGQEWWWMEGSSLQRRERHCRWLQLKCTDHLNATPLHASSNSTATQQWESSSNIIILLSAKVPDQVRFELAILSGSFHVLPKCTPTDLSLDLFGKVATSCKKGKRELVQPTIWWTCNATKIWEANGKCCNILLGLLRASPGQWWGHLFLPHAASGLPWAHKRPVKRHQQVQPTLCLAGPVKKWESLHLYTCNDNVNTSKISRRVFGKDTFGISMCLLQSQTLDKGY